MTMKIEVLKEERDRMLVWIKDRGGVAVWEAIDLAIAGRRTFTPGDAGRPSWQYGVKPVAIITDPDDITTYTETLYKAIPVTLRAARGGMLLKLSDASQRKVDKLLAACTEQHGNAHWKKDVLPDAAASIGVFWSS